MLASSYLSVIGSRQAGFHASFLDPLYRFFLVDSSGERKITVLCTKRERECRRLMCGGLINPGWQDGLGRPPPGSLASKKEGSFVLDFRVAGNGKPSGTEEADTAPASTVMCCVSVGCCVKTYVPYRLLPPLFGESRYGVDDAQTTTRPAQRADVVARLVLGRLAVLSGPRAPVRPFDRPAARSPPHMFFSIVQ